jgi:hypothetical protein
VHLCDSLPTIVTYRRRHQHPQATIARLLKTLQATLKRLDQTGKPVVLPAGWFIPYKHDVCIVVEKEPDDKFRSVTPKFVQELKSKRQNVNFQISKL